MILGLGSDDMVVILGCHDHFLYDFFQDIAAKSMLVQFDLIIQLWNAIFTT